MFRLFGPPRLGLALGSGADRGYAHLGVLQVLFQEDIFPMSLSGSSIGALVAAYYALHQSIDPLINLASSLRPRDLLSLVDLNNPKNSLIKGELIRSFLRRELYGEADFSQLKIPLTILATSLENGLAVKFTSGSILDAVMASISVPGIFPPFSYKGLSLIDGGLASPLPLAYLPQMGATALIGVDLYGFTTTQAVASTTLGVLDRTYKIYLSRLTQADSGRHYRRSLVLKPELNRTWDSMSFTHFTPNFLAGRQEALSQLPYIKKLIHRL